MEKFDQNQVHFLNTVCLIYVPERYLKASEGSISSLVFWNHRSTSMSLYLFKYAEGSGWLDFIHTDTFNKACFSSLSLIKKISVTGHWFCPL